MRKVFFLAVMVSVGFLATAGVVPCRGTEIDSVVAEVNAQLEQLRIQAGIAPPQPVDDATFLRRAWLDLVGTVPSPSEVVRFLDDTSPNKRAVLVDTLLADERYARRWSDYWERVLMGPALESATVDQGAFRQWLQEQFAANTPWDKIVRTLLTAEGVNLSGNEHGDTTSKSENEKHHPAVNWFIRHSQNLPELSATTSRVFLGVQIQCAQCHDHKEENWKQEDFRRFTAYFAKTWPMLNGPYPAEGKVRLIELDLRDRLFAPPTGGKLEMFFGSYRDYIGVTPRTLDGQEFTKWSSRRVALADWMTHENNRWFAPAIVNRMWGELLGAGFVEPIDDFRTGNPAIAPATLELLARDFRTHGYDLQRLLRIITRVQAYQAQCGNVSLSQPRQGYWSVYPLKPLSIEVLFDTVLAATGAERALDRTSRGKRDLVRAAFVQQFTLQLGIDETLSARATPESIAQALMQMNGVLFCGSVQAGNQTALDETWQVASDDAGRIEQLYLRTLTRRPTADERTYWIRFVNAPRTAVKTPGTQPTSPYKVKGLSAILTSPEIRHAKADADFRELLQHAKTGADFAALGKRMTNLVEAGMYVRALREFAADAPFQAILENGGGTTPAAQAYEDMFWALLNSSEFLNNH